MSLRVLWRSTVFIITLVLIYLAFPVLIVPSSLPAIQAMFVQNEIPEEFMAKAPTVSTDTPADAQIYQLNIPAVPTLKDKLQVLKTIHQEGMDKILQR